MEDIQEKNHEQYFIQGEYSRYNIDVYPDKYYLSLTKEKVDDRKMHYQENIRTKNSDNILMSREESGNCSSFYKDKEWIIQIIYYFDTMELLIKEFLIKESDTLFNFSIFNNPTLFQSSVFDNPILENDLKTNFTNDEMIYFIRNFDAEDYNEAFDNKVQDIEKLYKNYWFVVLNATGKDKYGIIDRKNEFIVQKFHDYYFDAKNNAKT